MSRVIELKGLTPLVIRKAELDGESVSICRCGLSATFPFCDGSHRAARGEEEGRVYQYVREVPSGKLVRLDMARPSGEGEVAQASPQEEAPPPRNHSTYI